MAGRGSEGARERSRSRSPSGVSQVRGAVEDLDHLMRHGVAPYSRPYSTSQFTQRLKVHAIVGCSGRKTDPHVDGEAGESSQHLGLTTEEWSSRVGPNGGRCGRPPPPSISPLGFDVRPVSKSGPERGRRRGRPMPTSKLPSRCFRRALAVGAPPSPFPLRFGIGSANGGGRGGGRVSGAGASESSGMAVWPEAISRRDSAARIGPPRKDRGSLAGWVGLARRGQGDRRASRGRAAEACAQLGGDRFRFR